MPVSMSLPKKSIDIEIEHATLKFLYTPNSKHPGKNDLIPYFAAIYQLNKYDNSALLDFSYGAELVRLYSLYVYATMKKPDAQTSLSIQEVLGYFGNDTIKGIYVEKQLSGYKSLEKFNEEIGL